MKQKTLCVLVDDDEGSLSRLKSAIEELQLLEVERAFTDPDKFLAAIDKLKSNIVFLDMDMPIPGDEVAQKLRNKKVIFVSGHQELAHAAFDVNAVDFVKKPIRINRLKEAILKVLDHGMNETIIAVRTDIANKSIIRIDEIVYIRTHEKAPRDKVIYLESGEELRAKDIDFENLLIKLPKWFYKVDPSTIVNKNFVKSILPNDEITIDYPKQKGSKDLKVLSVTNKFRDEFFNSF